MSEKYKQALLRGNAAISEGNHEGFLELCTEDTRWEFVGEQVLQGKQAVREYMQKTYLEPPKFSVDKLVCEDDMLIAIGNISMKDTTGTLRHYHYCDVWRLEEGLFAELRAFVVEKNTI